MTIGSCAIQTKSLTILEDQMQHEFLACVKAEHYANTFQDASLKALATQLANGHRQRYDRLLNYLNSHA